MTVATKLLLSLGVGKIPVSMTWKSETAGKSTQIPHCGKREQDRNRMHATQNPHNFIQMAALQENCHSKKVKETVPKTSRRYDKDGVKIRRPSKKNRLTKIVEVV